MTLLNFLNGIKRGSTVWILNDKNDIAVEIKRTKAPVFNRIFAADFAYNTIKTVEEIDGIYIVYLNVFFA